MPLRHCRGDLDPWLSNGLRSVGQSQTKSTRSAILSVAKESITLVLINFKLLSIVSGSVNSLATDKRANTSSKTSPMVLKQNMKRIMGGGEGSVDVPKAPRGAGKLGKDSGAHSLYGFERWPISSAGRRGSLLLPPPGMSPEIAAAMKRLKVDGSNAGPAAERGVSSNSKESVGGFGCLTNSVLCIERSSSSKRRYVRALGHDDNAVIKENGDPELTHSTSIKDMV